jgi:hypothetical protein
MTEKITWETHGKWGKYSRQVIDQVVQANPNTPPAGLVKLISKAYPFGQRYGWPYQSWLRQVKMWKVEVGLLPNPKVKTDSDQMGLF